MRILRNYRYINPLYQLNYLEASCGNLNKDNPLILLQYNAGKHLKSRSIMSPMTLTFFDYLDRRYYLVSNIHPKT